MTIGTFLDNCQTDETALSILKRNNEHVYDGTIRSFKVEDDLNGVKSKLVTKRIFEIVFDSDLYLLQDAIGSKPTVRNII